MGRIANALKKAESERREKLRLGGGLDARDRGGLPATLRVGSSRATIGTADCVTPAPIIEIGSIPAAHSPIARPATAPSWNAHASLVAVNDPGSTITEQYRAVRTWLLSRMTPGERACVAITSSVPREGKSVTTANLAAVLAEVRHMQVLAVDCDFRQGSLSRLFKTPNAPGLSGVLTGRATVQDAIVRTPIGNLSVLPAGSCANTNPAELLNSKSASRLFDEIRERYHYVLVDTPPVQRLADVGVIGALCSGVLMVVRMHQTSSNLVRQSVRWLQSNNLQVMGCIAAASRPNDDRYAYTTEERDG